jgi:glucose-6-phosphate isomerase
VFFANIQDTRKRCDIVTALQNQAEHTMSKNNLWARYQQGVVEDETTGFFLDVSGMNIQEAWTASMQGQLAKAFDAMEALENGSVANPDEGRQVGHYWLRDPERAPAKDIRHAIEQTVVRVERFAQEVHATTVVPPGGGRFRNVLVVGIGGSALGPQLVTHALRGSNDPCKAFYIDNTDPDGIDATLAQVGSLADTLTLVISKSGGTKETRNGMLEVAKAYTRAGLSFGLHAAAVTGEGSELDRVAIREGWRARFPMWDWVGGRTSLMSAVGLLPAALQGFDVRAMLSGAKAMDTWTRERSLRNPAARMALAWHHASNGRGEKAMVVLPYRDRLEPFSRYLQQLVMESIGKECDVHGNVVNQGLTVYGNKGSTDQHAYVQQLRDGIANVFVTFIEVLRDRTGDSMEVEAGITSGDYLYGFMEGTRTALEERGRPSMTLTIPDVNARTLGSIVALYERAVGLYASLVDVNAYHQPGVEAGKKAAGYVLQTLRASLAVLRNSTESMSAEEVARAAGIESIESVYKALRHASGSEHHKIVRVRDDGVWGGRFCSLR